MKKTFLLFLCLSLFLIAQSQVSKTINLTTAGTLSTLLTTTEKTTITNLTVTGEIDARDVKCMRDEVTRLAVLDLGAASIKEYSGSEGTLPYSSLYPANEMPKYSFYNPTFNISKIKLRTITLPATLTSIGIAAFSGCTGLTGSLTFPNSVTSIGDGAFYNCNGLTGSLIIPNSVTFIGESAFYGCSGLSGDLTLPDSLVTIRNDAFRKCTGLTGNLTIPGLVTSIGSHAFAGCTGLTGSLILSNSVRYIGHSAFTGCIGFSSLTIGSGVDFIGDYAFSECTSLRKISVTGFLPPDISYSTFSEGIKKTTVLEIPAGSKGAYQADINWNSFHLITEISPALISRTTNLVTAGTLSSVLSHAEKATVTNLVVSGNIDARDVKCMRDEMSALAVLDLSAASILEYSGSGGTDGNSSSYPADEMPNYSFYNPTTDISKVILRTITLPATLTCIGKSAFNRCRNLAGNLTLPVSLTSIEEGAFFGCKGLTGNLTIPVSLTSIEDSAFFSCRGLTGNLTIPRLVTSIGSFAFSGCTGLTGNLILPNSVTSIEDYAFDGCKGLTGLTLPGSLISIGSRAFANCSGLKGNLILPNSVTSIGDVAFANCTGLEGSLTLSNSLSSIGAWAFSGCTGLKGNLIIPNSVTSIKELAFDRCSGLTGLILPGSVTSIEFRAFEGCTGLQKITVACSLPPDIYFDTFDGVNKETTVLEVPIGSKDSYKAYNYWSLFLLINEATTGINETFMPDQLVKVYTSHSEIVVEGTSRGETVSVYTLNGVQLQSIRSQGELILIPVQHTGGYLVRTATKTFKVVL